MPRMLHSQIFREKTFANNHKTAKFTSLLPRLKFFVYIQFAFRSSNPGNEAIHVHLVLLVSFPDP